MNATVGKVVCWILRPGSVGSGIGPDRVVGVGRRLLRLEGGTGEFVRQPSEVKTKRDIFLLSNGRVVRYIALQQLYYVRLRGDIVIGEEKSAKRKKKKSSNVPTVIFLLFNFNFNFFTKDFQRRIYEVMGINVWVIFFLSFININVQTTTIKL